VAARSGAAPPAFRYDVTSGILYLAAAEALIGLVGFIARNKFGAAVEWVGLISSAAYMGFVWNLFMGRLTALVSLRHSMMLIMALSGLLLWLGALQTTAAGFSLVVIVFLLAYGLFSVQYNTLVGHLYTQEERPRLVSRRYLAVSAVSIGEVALFGWLSKGSLGHVPTFLLAGSLMIVAAWIFRSIPTVGEHMMESFRMRDVARAALRDAAFRRLALVLSFYGWVGAGITPALVLLYQRCGFQEDKVGLAAAAKTVGLLFGLLAITSRMKFIGGLTNFRLSFMTALVSVLCYGAAGFFDLGSWALAVVAFGQFMFGISNAGFNLANATTGINLAPPGQTTLYVNALMIVLGVRGIVMPIVVSVFLRWAGLFSALAVSIGVAAVCSLISVVPGIDAMGDRSKPKLETEESAPIAR
jgi:Major Facilitator Superfamily